MPRLPITIQKNGDASQFAAKIKTIGKLATYVGIPAGSSIGRSQLIRRRANKFSSKRKSRALTAEHLINVATDNTMSNAALLYFFSKGSIRRSQPPRPVLEPAIQADGNKQEIAALVAEAVALYIEGKVYKSKQKLKSAGARSAKAARDWFLDSRNGWPENAESTLRNKKSTDPGIDTGIMRTAITHIEEEIQ